MSRWPEVDLGDLATCLDSRRVPIKEDERPPNGTVPYYGANGQVGWMNTLLFDEPLLLIAEDGGFFDQPEKGVAYLISGPSWVNNHAHVLRPNPSKVRLEFLGYFFRHFNFLPYITGTTRSKLTQKDLFKVKVPLPSLPEQERIVRILNEADQLRRLRAEAGRHTADLVPALFHEMFGNPPKTWPVAKFGDLGTLDRGRSKHRPRDEANLFGGPYPFIQTGDIANSGGCIEAYTQTYSELGLSQSKLWPERTLCITIAANIAKCAVLSFPACFPDSVVGFIPNELILVEFAQSWLETLQTKLEDEAPQAAQKNINLQTLRNLELRVPPVELQRTFAVRVAEIREMGAEQAASRRRLDDLFQSLLHRAFQGEL